VTSIVCVVVHYLLKENQTQWQWVHFWYVNI